MSDTPEHVPLPNSATEAAHLIVDRHANDQLPPNPVQFMARTIQQLEQMGMAFIVEPRGTEYIHVRYFQDGAMFAEDPLHISGAPTDYFDPVAQAAHPRIPLVGDGS